MEKATSNTAIWVVFMAIATCVAFSRLPTVAEAGSLLQEQCFAKADCNMPECTSGTVVCIDNTCTCMLVLGPSAPATEIVVQSPEIGECWTSDDCEETKCAGGRAFCMDMKCICLEEQQIGKACSVVGDCVGFVCLGGNIRCVGGRCMCMDKPPVPPLPLPLSPSSS